MKFFKRIARRLGYEYRLRSTAPRWITVPDGSHKGVSLFIHPERHPTYLQMSQGVFDRFMYDELARMPMPQGCVIWDVGAHFGYHTLGFAAIAGERGSIIAFEPNPFNRLRLKEHLERNPGRSSRVTICESALADRSGECELVFSDDVDGGKSSGGFLSGVLPPLAGTSYQSFRRMSVTVVSADALVEQGLYPAPDVMKIDVEGAESAVLEGSKKILATGRPALFIEVHTIVQMLKVSTILLGAGYGIRLLDEEHAKMTLCAIAAVHPSGFGRSDRS